MIAAAEMRRAVRRRAGRRPARSSPAPVPDIRLQKPAISVARNTNSKRRPSRALPMSVLRMIRNGAADHQQRHRREGAGARPGAEHAQSSAAGWWRAGRPDSTARRRQSRAQATATFALNARASRASNAVPARVFASAARGRQHILNERLTAPAGSRRPPPRPWHTRRRFEFRGGMSTLTHPPARAPRPVMRRRRGPNPLAAPLLVFAAVIVLAACYVAYVLWPRWPEAPVALDAPSLPIVVAGVAFNIEPAAIRVAVQRRPGAQERVDLAYLWPSLSRPIRRASRRSTALDARRPAVRHHRGRRRRRCRSPSGVKTIYPRYLARRRRPPDRRA